MKVIGMGINAGELVQIAARRRGNVANAIRSITRDDVNKIAGNVGRGVLIGIVTAGIIIGAAWIGKEIYEAAIWAGKEIYEAAANIVKMSQ